MRKFHQADTGESGRTVLRPNCRRETDELWVGWVLRWCIVKGGRRSCIQYDYDTIRDDVVNGKTFAWLVRLRYVQLREWIGARTFYCQRVFCEISLYFLGEFTSVLQLKRRRSYRFVRKPHRRWGCSVHRQHSMRYNTNNSVKMPRMRNASSGRQSLATQQQYQHLRNPQRIHYLTQTYFSAKYAGN